MFEFSGGFFGFPGTDTAATEAALERLAPPLSACPDDAAWSRECLVGLTSNWFNMNIRISIIFIYNIKCS